MNRILALIFSLATLAAALPAAGQKKYYTSADYGWQYPRMKFDSTAHIPTFNGAPTLRGSVTTKNAAIAFDSTNHLFYFYDPKTMTWDTIRGGSGGGTTYDNGYGLGLTATTFRVDSSIIASRARLTNSLSLKLNITDTANIALRPIAGSNMTITGTYPNLTFASSGGGAAGGANVGGGSINIFKDVSGTDLRFRTLTNSTASGAVKFKLINDTISGSITDTTKILNTDFAEGKTAYTTVNPSTFTYTQQAASIRVAGTSTDFTNYIKSTSVVTSSNRYMRLLPFKWVSAGGAARLGPGMYDASDPIMSEINISAGGAATVKLTIPTSQGVYATGGETFTVSNGDSLVAGMIRQDRTMLVFLYKPATREIITTVKTFDLTSESTIHRVAAPTVFFSKGTIDMYNDVTVDMSSANLWALFGDSRSEGAKAGVGAPSALYGNQSRVFNCLLTSFGPGLNFSMGGNTTTDALNAVKEARKFRPGFAFISIGTNDALATLTSTQYASALKEIKFAAIASGMIPVFITPNPWHAGSNATNHLLKQYRSVVTGLSPDLQTVDTYGGVVAAGDSSIATVFDSGDGHENSWGNLVTGDAITQGMKGAFPSGRAGTMSLLSNGNALDLYSPAGYNNITANGNLQFSLATGAARFYTDQGLQAFTSDASTFMALYPAQKRVWFSAPDISMTYFNGASSSNIATFLGTGRVMLPQYAAASNADSVLSMTTDGTINKVAKTELGVPIETVRSEISDSLNVPIYFSDQFDPTKNGSDASHPITSLMINDDSTASRTKTLSAAEILSRLSGAGMPLRVYNTFSAIIQTDTIGIDLVRADETHSDSTIPYMRISNKLYKMTYSAIVDPPPAVGIYLTAYSSSGFTQSPTGTWTASTTAYMTANQTVTGDGGINCVYDGSASDDAAIMMSEDNSATYYGAAGNWAFYVTSGNYFFLQGAYDAFGYGPVTTAAVAGDIMWVKRVGTTVSCGYTRGGTPTTIMTFVATLSGTAYLKLAVPNGKHLTEVKNQ